MDCRTRHRIDSTPLCIRTPPPRATYRRHEPPFAAEQYARPPRRRVITLNHVPRRAQRRREREKKRGRETEERRKKENARADARAIKKRSPTPIILRTFHFKRIRTHVYSCSEMNRGRRSVSHVAAALSISAPKLKVSPNATSCLIKYILTSS